MFGVVSLLVVLVIVGLVAVKSLKTVGPATALPAGASQAPSGAGTVRAQSAQLQHAAQDDVKKALEQAAGARSEQADK